MNRKIDAIVFDAYGTLLDVSSIDRRLAHYFGEQAPEIAGLWRAKQLEYTWLRTLMGRYIPFSAVTREALLYTAQRLLLPLTDAITDDLLQHYNQLTAYVDVAPTLAVLKGEYKLAVLSNADLPMLTASLDYNGLTSGLTKVLSADRVQLFKPKPEVYTLATEAFGVEPGQVLFVSSNPWDVAGAKSFGFKVFWINRKGLPADQLGAFPDETIDDLASMLPFAP